MDQGVIAYGSTTGNTAAMATIISAEIKNAGVECVVKNVRDIDCAELLHYDLIMLGASTWGDGELQDDCIAFVETLKTVSLAGKRVACFGPGDSMYPQFCKAVDDLETIAQACGATIVTGGLKIDGDVSSQADCIQEWTKQVMACA